MSEWPEPSLRYLAGLTDDVGVAERAPADAAEPGGQPATGYRTGDAGLALALAAGLDGDRDARRVAAVSLAFLTRSYEGAGRFRAWFGADGTWPGGHEGDAPGSSAGDPAGDEASGRAVLGLGVAVARAVWPEMRTHALRLFGAAAQFRTARPRAMGYAALGAAAVLRARPGHPEATALLADAADLLPGPSGDPGWPWPEARLGDANAVVPGALLAAARATGRTRLADSALELLAWLVGEELRDGWFSFTPAGGRGPGDPRPAFEQRPAEAAAMAGACARAFRETGEPGWAAAACRAAAWFLGANDSRVRMFDPRTLAGFDGLRFGGVNPGRSAESAIAFAAAMARVRALRP